MIIKINFNQRRIELLKVDYFNNLVEKRKLDDRKRLLNCFNVFDLDGNRIDTSFVNEMVKNYARTRKY